MRESRGKQIIHSFLFSLCEYIGLPKLVPPIVFPTSVNGLLIPSRALQKRKACFSVPHIHAIVKSYWLDLQNAARIQPVLPSSPAVIPAQVTSVSYRVLLEDPNRFPRSLHSCSLVICSQHSSWSGLVECELRSCFAPRFSGLLVHSGWKLKSSEWPLGTSMVVQQWRVRTPNAGGLGSIPGQGTRSHRPQLRGRLLPLRPGAAK